MWPMITQTMGMKLTTQDQKSYRTMERKRQLVLPNQFFMIRVNTFLSATRL